MRPGAFPRNVNCVLARTEIIMLYEVAKRVRIANARNFCASLTNHGQRIIRMVRAGGTRRISV